MSPEKQCCHRWGLPAPSNGRSRRAKIIRAMPAGELVTRLLDETRQQLTREHGKPFGDPEDIDSETARRYLLLEQIRLQILDDAVEGKPSLTKS